jgi:hypothetical protein
MSYTFSTLDDNVATNGTYLTGINDAGEIVGFFLDANGNTFTFLDHQNYFENLTASTTGNPPTVSNEFFAINNTGGALVGGPNGIQNVGQPVGVVTTSDSTYGGILSSVISNNTLTIFTDQPYANQPNNFLDPTTFTGINDQDEIVGVAQIGAANGGFLLPQGYANYSTGGTVSGQPVAINDPNAGSGASQGTLPSGINDVGTIVGSYVDSNGIEHGFIDNGGNFTTLDVPASLGGAATNAVATLVSGINNAGEVVGSYGDGQNGAIYGFVYETEGSDAGTYYTFSFPSSNYTVAGAINDLGEIVGHSVDYIDGSYQTNGFTASDPPPSMMMRNINSGAFEIYNVNNNQLGSPVALRTVGLDWQVAGYGDFSGKTNESGVLLRNADTGAFEIYNINDNKLIGPAALSSLNMLGLDWQVAGVGDFSGNVNETDMLLRNTNTGAFEIYDINGDKVTGQHALRPVSLDWQVAGVGDFSGKANETDLLLRNSDTGAFDIYDISDNKLTGIAALKMIGLDWQVAGVGDFSSIANEPDLLLRNTNTGAFEIYDISDNKVTATASLGQVGLSWSVAGFGDFGGHPGETDMLLRNNDTGAFKVYDIADNRLVSTAFIGQVGKEWQFSGLPAEPSIGPSSTFQLIGSGAGTDPLLPPMPPHNN